MTGLGSALWINVGPCAAVAAAWGAFTLVNALAIVLVAVLAMLVTAAGSLVAADWRADIASGEAWAEIATAGVEVCLPAEAAAPSNIHPCYLVGVDSERLRRVFRAHRRATPAPGGTRTPAVVPAARIIAEASEPLPTLEASEATPLSLSRSVALPFPNAPWSARGIGRLPIDHRAYGQPSQPVAGRDLVANLPQARFISLATAARGPSGSWAIRAFPLELRLIGECRRCHSQRRPKHWQSRCAVFGSFDKRWRSPQRRAAKSPRASFAGRSAIAHDGNRLRQVGLRGFTSCGPGGTPPNRSRCARRFRPELTRARSRVGCDRDPSRSAAAGLTPLRHFELGLRQILSKRFWQWSTARSCSARFCR